jgi:hypothetical protein
MEDVRIELVLTLKSLGEKFNSRMMVLIGSLTTELESSSQDINPAKLKHMMLIGAEFIKDLKPARPLLKLEPLLLETGGKVAALI